MNNSGHEESGIGEFLNFGPFFMVVLTFDIFLERFQDLLALFGWRLGGCVSGGCVGLMGLAVIGKALLYKHLLRNIHH